MIKVTVNPAAGGCLASRCSPNAVETAPKS